MKTSGKSLIIGALALTGVTMAPAASQAMPVGPATSAASVEQVQYYYGGRGPFWRYGVRRPFLGYRRFGFRPYGYGFARPLRPYGFRRPYYGYRRF